VAIKSKLPLEAVRSERPSGEGGFAGGAEGYGERGVCAGECTEVVDVCECRAFVAEFFGEGSFVPSVYLR